jgi:prepilin-type N-terminal cleavage/methylation domain-containing protein
MQTRSNRAHGAAGFSLIELMVALGITLIIMVVAGRMLAMSLNVRMRENQRTEAVADAQRALQMITRDITNAGLGLTTNGLSSADPTEEVYGQIRIRSNLNAFNESPANTTSPGDDVAYELINDTTVIPAQRLVTRQDINTKQISQLANRIDALQFEFLNATGTVVTPDKAVKVRITVTVSLPSIGTPRAEGYQPPTRMQLRSEATLRNSVLKQ